MNNKRMMSFEEVVCNAMNEMDYNILDKVIKFSDSDDWSDEDWENYNKVAKLIVEPESFIDRDRYEYSEEESDYYHNLGEDKDFIKQWAYIRNCMGEIDPRIIKLSELISKVGY